jgi:hypothetical protein
MRNVDFDRAAGDASRVLAAYAPLSFEERLVFSETDCYFTKVSATDVGFLTRHRLAGRFRCAFDSDLLGCQLYSPSASWQLALHDPAFVVRPSGGS